jgi:hypothetical protein
MNSLEQFLPFTFYLFTFYLLLITCLCENEKLSFELVSFIIRFAKEIFRKKWRIS